MNIKSLRYFVELAREGSFYAASKGLLISQQGLSKAISSLEDEMGLTLVERSQRGVRLTREGEVFLKHAQIMVSQHDAMIADMYAGRRAQGAPDERIMVHVSYYSAQIAAFDPEYIRKLTSGTSYIEEPFEKLIRRATVSDGNDLVFLDLHPYSTNKVKQRSDVAFDKVFDTRYGVVWREGSSLSFAETVHREEVEGLPVAMNASREIAQLVEWLFEGYQPLDVHMGATSPHMLLEYVRLSDNDAIAIFDSFSFYLAKQFFPEITRNLHFTPFATPNSVCEIGFLYPRNARLSMRAQNTVKRLRRFIDRTCSDYLQGMVGM